MRIKKNIISLYEKVYSSNLMLSIKWKLEHINNYVDILNSEDTLKYIIDTKSSISRFGDGEFELILGLNNNLGFQNNSQELSKRLKEVLIKDNENILICIPHSFNSFKG